MVVQHNLTAMNSNRMLNVNTKTQAKSTEKLSSGYKINRAADDAAGLSISEKMRKQIRGLTQASANAQDGISAVQTAEGALNEVQDMLQRMNELAVKAANGTNSVDDRSYIQNEVDQLVTEIDRVAETTKFNETYLLKGDKGVDKDYSYSYAKASAENKASFAAALAEPDVSGKAGTGNLTITFENLSATSTTEDSKAQNMLASQIVKSGIKVTAGADNTKATIEISGYSVSNTAANTYAVNDANGNKLATITLAAAGTSGQSSTYSATSYKAAMAKNETYSYYDANGNKISANALDNYLSSTTSSGTITTTQKSGATLYDIAGNEIDFQTANVTAAQDITGALNLKLHVGADATANNQISVDVKAMSAKGIGVDGLKVDGATDANALDAIETIKAAIQKISTQRSALGAVQNRLDHTISNLDNVVENTTSAESQIRDTDMAKEMVKYSNNNILSQAGQAMLAQANQVNQGVLSLLR